MKISVLMSVYKNDHPLYLQEAIKSVINQTLPPDEIILVIDGLVPENLYKSIACIKKKYAIIKTIQLPKNVGLGNALKEGLKHCSHDLVARMDSDDISRPQRFEKQSECFVEDENLGVVGGSIREFVTGKEFSGWERRVPLENGDILSYMKKRCPFNHMSVMFKRSDVEKAGGYIDWHYNEDYYLWIRMALSGCKFKNLQDILVDVRVNDQMYQRRGGYRYFLSEEGVQRYMLQKRMISYFQYLFNVIVRFIIQYLMPNKLRKVVYMIFFRSTEI